MEPEERWIATIRETLERSDESLPEGGWEALERDLAAAGRRRRVFAPVWKKIAAVAAVVAIAVLIGETVVNQGVVDGDRQTTFFAGELTTADGQLLLDGESLRTEVPAAGFSEPAAPLTAKVRKVLAESRSATAAAAVVTAQAFPVETAAEEPSLHGAAADVSAEAESSADRPDAAAEQTEPAEPAEQPDGSVAAARGARRTITGTIPDEAPQRVFEPTRAPRRTSVGLFAAGLPTAQHVSSGRATPLAPASTTHVLSSSGIFRMKRGYDDYLYRHKQPLSFGISVRKEFGHGLSLESGLVYSLLRSDVRVSQNDESFSQTLHMLGIPLRVNWDFLARSNWKLYLGAGGMVEKSLYAKFGSESVAEKELQWSLTANAGVQYDFTPRTALYFEPGVSCYLTETALRTTRTVSPVNLSLQLGVRLTY